MALWAYKNGVHLDFIPPGKPVENGYIERFQRQATGRVPRRGDFLSNVADARRQLHLWRQDYNHHRPHSALSDRPPRQSSLPRAVVEKTAVKPPWKTLRVSHRRSTTGIIGKNNYPSTRLLAALT